MKSLRRRGALKMTDEELEQLRIEIQEYIAFGRGYMKEYSPHKVRKILDISDNLRAELGILLEEFYDNFPAGLGYNGDAILHLLRQLRDNKPFTSWGAEITKIIEQGEKQMVEKKK